MPAARGLPEPVDPAAPPRRLMRAAALTVAAGLGLLLFGVAVAHRGAQPPRALLVGWLVSLPLSAALLLAYAGAARERLRRYEHRAGFLPRAGRRQLPAGGRRTLYRVEYGSDADRLCVMVARWDYSSSEGWRRGSVVEHAWVASDDAVSLGEQRARLTALAEELEERLDDVRLDADGNRRVTNELLAEQRTESERSHRFAEELARESL